MPAGRYRSRTLRRVFRKTPGNRVVLHYKKRKPQKAKCGSCGAILNGMARELPSRLKNLSKSQKKPSRVFGGNLCSKCSRKIIIEKARNESL
jgi:large subunit ribosomal protein L34e